MQCYRMTILGLINQVDTIFTSGTMTWHEIDVRFWTSRNTFIIKFSDILVVVVTLNNVQDERKALGLKIMTNRLFCA